MIIEAEPTWLLCSSSFLFGSLFVFVVACLLFRPHESVAFVLGDVLVTDVKNKAWGAEDGGPSLNEGVLHQIRAAQTDPNNCYLIIRNREMHHSAC